MEQSDGSLSLQLRWAEQQWQIVRTAEKEYFVPATSQNKVRNDYSENILKSLVAAL
jgi:hypothetical protein